MMISDGDDEECEWLRVRSNDPCRSVHMWSESEEDISVARMNISVRPRVETSFFFSFLFLFHDFSPDELLFEWETFEIFARGSFEISSLFY